MADKIYKTKGIILRTVKYGETSLVVSVYTELFGLQSYLINGIRAPGKKGSSKASYFQPAAILDLVVYHNELKQLQRIKEYRWAYLYQSIMQDVPKNTVVLFMVELLSKCLKQPENNSDLFYFTEDALMQLDQCSAKALATYPLFFALHLAIFFGVTPQLPSREQAAGAELFFDLQEGMFSNEMPPHIQFADGAYAEAIADLLRVRHPEELNDLTIHPEVRRKLFVFIEQYYTLHITDFGTLKTLPVLREILR